MGRNHYSEFETRGGFNYRFISTLMGALCFIQVVFLLCALGISLYYHDASLNAILQTIVIDSVLGTVLLLLGRGNGKYDTGRREGMVSVAISWIVVSILGMLPYFLGGFIPNLADAFFETISGLTTTGASILTEIESLPKGILFWRSVTQWIGGIGIIVFMVAIIPMTGESASLIYDYESTGVTHDRFTPRFTVMAKWVSVIYASLTLLCITLLWMGPFGLFDAVCHGLTCISTGGFSTFNDSIVSVNSHYINFVLILFMFIGSVSFTLTYFALVRREPQKMLRDSEFRWYVVIILLLSFLSAAILYFSGRMDSFLVALEQSLFQIVSLISTTGYAIADFNNWGSAFWVLALFAMFVAGCSGSTSGGLKVIRFNILTRSLFNEFKKRTHPHAVIPLQVNGSVLQNKYVMQVYNFFFAYLFLIVIGTFSLTIEGYNLEEAISVAISSVSNTGPGLLTFGPLSNWSYLSDFNTILMGILMMVGRLEIFTVMTLFHKSFWRN